MYFTCTRVRGIRKLNRHLSCHATRISFGVHIENGQGIPLSHQNPSRQLVLVEGPQYLDRLAIDRQLNQPAARLVKPSSGNRAFCDGSLQSLARVGGKAKHLVHKRLDDSVVEKERPRQRSPGKHAGRNHMLQKQPGPAGAQGETEQVEGRKDRPDSGPPAFAAGSVVVSMVRVAVMPGMSASVVGKVVGVAMATLMSASPVKESQRGHCSETDNSDNEE